MDCKHRKESVMLGVRYDDECELCAAEAEASRHSWGRARQVLLVLALAAVTVLISGVLGYVSVWFFGVAR